MEDAAKVRKKKNKFPCPEEWKKNIEKRERYKPKKVPSKTECSHKKHTSYHCKEITMDIITRFHEMFYKVPDRQYQNDFILKYVRIINPKNERKSMFTTFFIDVPKGKKSIKKKICRNLFMTALGINRARVQRLCRVFQETGAAAPETRGGDTKSAKYEARRSAVKKFIEPKLTPELQFSGGKSVFVYNMPNDLTIKKMYDMYRASINENKDLDVQFSYFRNICVKDYSISTASRSPVADTKTVIDTKHHDNENPMVVKKVKQKCLNEIDVKIKPDQSKFVNEFDALAYYWSQRLSRLDQNQRIIAETRIHEILSQAEMGKLYSDDRFPTQNTFHPFMHAPQMYVDNNFAIGSSASSGNVHEPQDPLHTSFYSSTNQVPTRPCENQFYTAPKCLNTLC